MCVRGGEAVLVALNASATHDDMTITNCTGEDWKASQATADSHSQSLGNHRTNSSLWLCRQNMEDALDKLQSIIEDAIKALTPTIADEDTVKRVKAK